MSEDPAQSFDEEEILEHVQSLGDIELTKQEREGLRQILQLTLVHKVFGQVYEGNRNTAAELLGLENISTQEGIAQALRLQGAASGALNVIDTFFRAAAEPEMQTEDIDPEVTDG